MKNFLLFSTTAGSGAEVDKFSLSLTTLLLGMLVVFAVLLLIMLVIMLVGKIFQKAENKKNAKKAVDAPVTLPSDQTVPDGADAGENEEEIVAAISAAIALCLDEEPGSFRVVSFRKTASKPAWNKK